MPKQFQIEIPFALPPCDRAMLDAHFLSVVADLLVEVCDIRVVCGGFRMEC